MAANNQKGPAGANYDEEKNKLKRFLAEFHTKNARGHKEFVYARQITNIAHREQVNITIDLEQVAEFDSELVSYDSKNHDEISLILISCFSGWSDPK